MPHDRTNFMTVAEVIEFVGLRPDELFENRDSPIRGLTPKANQKADDGGPLYVIGEVEDFKKKRNAS